MKVSRWRIVALVAGGVILLPVLFVVIGFWPGSTKDIEAIANEFQPGDSWQLESERITPPRLICLQADCGEVSKSWELEENITTEDFVSILERSGWGDMIPDGIKCDTKSNVTSSGGQTMCEASGLRGGYNVEVRATGNYGNNLNASVSIWIHSRGR